MNGLELGVQALGERVDAALAEALTALRERDLGLADRVVRADLDINRLRYALEEQASAKLAGTRDPLEVRALVATLYVRDDLVVQEWTATATHVKPLRRGDIVAEPSGKQIEWDGMDVIPFEDGKIKRKDVYSDSVSILRQVGLL